MSPVNLLQELHCHLEECLSRNLQARCSPLVSQVLDTMRTEQTGDKDAAADLSSMLCSCMCVCYCSNVLSGIHLASSFYLF